jgi:multimeric flavodoxin WrbA
MNRVLGIVGSPRRDGNTHILVSHLLEGAREAGAAAETVLLGDLRIRECNGCHTCRRGKPCSKKDDMNALYPKIMEADSIVFGTPVYWYGPTALMKAFIDRFVYFNCPEHRARIAGKSAVAVVPLEDTDPDTWAPVVQFFAKSLAYLEMSLVGTVIAPGVGGKGEILGRPEILREAFEMGKRLGRMTTAREAFGAADHGDPDTMDGMQ